MRAALIDTGEKPLVWPLAVAVVVLLLGAGGGLLLRRTNNA